MATQNMTSVNLASLFESNTKFVFPTTASVRNSIPLWLKFYCYEYSSTALGRAQIRSSSGGGGSIIPGIVAKEKAQIWLPAQPGYQTTTAHTYTLEPTQAETLFPRAIGDVAATVTGKLPSGLVNTLEDVYKKAFDRVQRIERFGGRLSGFASDIQFDLKDNTYRGEGPSRNYEFRLLLPCLTADDSVAAANLIQAFEALSLPTARSFFAGLLTRYFHPPLWMFGIGPAGDYKLDANWSGSPQVCVLKTVSAKRTSFDAGTNALAGIGSGSGIKPVAYTLSLVFSELEPAFRYTTPGQSTSTAITNRSGVLVSTGSSKNSSVTSTAI